VCVGVDVRVVVAVFVAVPVGVLVGVEVAVPVGVRVGVLVGVDVGVFVAVFVGVRVDVLAGVWVGVRVIVGVLVSTVKVTVTDWAAFIMLPLHGLVFPEQALIPPEARLQPPNAEPAFALEVRVTLAPLAVGMVQGLGLPVHVVGVVMPPVTTTLPVPVPANVIVRFLIATASCGAPTLRRRAMPTSSEARNNIVAAHSVDLLV